MKIKDLIYQTPEMTEEKLLNIIDENLILIKKSLLHRIIDLHYNPSEQFHLSKAFLDEYDLIQDKKSNLTKSQRDTVTGFVSLCMIKMTKDDGRREESTSDNRLESIPEIEEVRNNSGD